jgi:RimJ/RimL family protein N-acetyltransferase
VSDSLSPTLYGTQCVLRALTIKDAPSLQYHADDDAVWRNLFEEFPKPYTLADAESWCVDGSRQESMGYVWGIEVDDQVVGCISMRPDKGWLRCNAEVGYWIGQSFWRRGITSDALRLVIDWSWENMLDLTRLYAPIFSWNDGSQAVAQKCGFTKEGALRRSAIKNGLVIDRFLWAILRTE